MSQWFPKIAAYDDEGFHPDVYIGKEFYGVFGDFEVIIDIEISYKVAAGAQSNWNFETEQPKIEIPF